MAKTIDQENILHLAAMNANPRTINAVLDKFGKLVNINEKDRRGNTPLMNYVQQFHPNPQVVKKMLSLNANPSL